MANYGLKFVDSWDDVKSALRHLSLFKGSEEIKTSAATKSSIKIMRQTMATLKAAGLASPKYMFVYGEGQVIASFGLFGITVWPDGDVTMSLASGYSKRKLDDDATTTEG